MRRLSLEEEVNDIDLQFFKNQTKPRIDLVGTLSTNGLAGSPRGLDLHPRSERPDGAHRRSAARRGCTGLEVPIVTASSCIPANLVGGYGQTLQEPLQPRHAATSSSA